MAVATLDRALERAAAFPGAGVRLLDRRERARWLSWAEILGRADRVAGGLQALGIGPGRRVAVVYPTGPDFLAAFFGALRAGAAPVPLPPPPRLGPVGEYRRRTRRLLEIAAPALVLAPPGAGGLLREAAPEGGTPLGIRHPGDLPRGALHPPGTDPGQPGLVQLSSGTTGEPKPALLSHRALLAQVRALNGLWPDGGGFRHSGLSWLPLHHDMGLVGCLLPALERPGVLTLIPPEVFAAWPAIWLRSIARYRASISPAPSFAFAHCARRVGEGELAGADLSCWRIAPVGAEPVAPGALRDFQRRFAGRGLPPEALTPVYGLAEAALAVTFSDSGRPFASRSFRRRDLVEGGRVREEAGGVEIVSLGRPLPGFGVEVRDEEGRASAGGTVGRIWVRGPSLMDGYLGDPAATAGSLRGGWLDTGDLGFLLGGELFLTGRAKELVVLRGRKYPPAEIEQAVWGVPGVRSGGAAAVSSMPPGGERELLVLFVERRRGVADGEVEAIPEGCRRAVLAATGLVVDRVAVVEPGVLPRTSSGKIRRREVCRRLEAGELAAGGPAPDPVAPGSRPGGIGGIEA